MLFLIAVKKIFYEWDILLISPTLFLLTPSNIDFRDITTFNHNEERISIFFKKHRRILFIFSLNVGNFSLHLTAEVFQCEYGVE